MARKKQQLINYHTSGKTSMPLSSEVQYGELVVRHNAEQPELLIKVADDKFATFVDKNAVETQVKNSADAFDLKINGVSASVKSDFATKVSLETASGNIETTITSLKTTLEAADLAITTELSAVSATVVANKSEFDSYKLANDTKVNTLSSGLTELSGATSAFSGTVMSEIGRLDGRVDSAFTSAVTVASAYTDAQIAVVQGEIDAVEKDVTGLTTSLTELSGVTSAFSGTVMSEIGRLDGRVDSAFTSAVTYVDAQVSAVTKSLTDKEDALDTRIKAVEVLTGTSESGVTSIVDKAIASVVSGAPAAFDTLKEIADWILQGSGATAADIVTDIESLKSADTLITTELSAVSATVIANKDAYDKYVEQNNKDIAALGAASAAVKTSVSELSDATEAEVARLDGRVDSAFTSAVTVASAYTDAQIAVVQGEIDAVDKRIKAVEAISSATTTAIQTATFAEGDAAKSGVKIEKSGTTLVFDFSELIIDCGEF